MVLAIDRALVIDRALAIDRALVIDRALLIDRAEETLSPIDRISETVQATR